MSKLLYSFHSALCKNHNVSKRRQRHVANINFSVPTLSAITLCLKLVIQHKFNKSRLMNNRRFVPMVFFNFYNSLSTCNSGPMTTSTDSEIVILSTLVVQNLILDLLKYCKPISFLNPFTRSVSYQFQSILISTI